jgi:hypothetical protein
MAFARIAYGNQPSIETVYSHATILAAIPPFGQRQPTLKRHDAVFPADEE